MTLHKGVYDNDYPDPDSRSEQEIENDHEKAQWALVSKTVVFGVGRVVRLTPSRLEQLRGMPYSAYLHSPEWQAKRALCLEDADHRCERCNRRGRLEVHHVTYQNRPMELRGDLRVLCHECHMECHPEKRAELNPQAPDPFAGVVPFRVTGGPA